MIKLKVSTHQRNHACVWTVKINSPQERVVNMWFDTTLAPAAKVGDGPKSCYHQVVKDFLGAPGSCSQVVPGQLFVRPGCQLNYGHYLV